jgi:hypothetical protein
MDNKVLIEIENRCKLRCINNLIKNLITLKTSLNNNNAIHEIELDYQELMLRINKKPKLILGKTTEQRAEYIKNLKEKKHM